MFPFLLEIILYDMDTVLHELYTSLNDFLFLLLNIITLIVYAVVVESTRSRCMI